MEEHIVKIIEKTVYADADDRLHDTEMAAKKIAKHFERFMEWAVRKEMLQYSSGAEEWQTTYCGNFLNIIKELYSDWLNNIDNK